jgi:hypothetical protein
MISLVKYHRGHDIEMISAKANFLQKLLERHIKEDGCFTLHGLLQIITTLDWLFS